MPTDNKTKLVAFVSARIEAAKAMPRHEARWFCDRWANYVDAELQRMSREAADDELSPHLEGLQAVDLIAASGELRAAAAGYAAPVEERAA